MKVGDVLRETGLTRKALYYYEEKGLVSPSHDSENNYRDYSREDLEKLKIVAALRQLGLSTGAIRDALRSQSETRKILSYHISEMSQRIEYLEHRKQMIETCLDSESGSFYATLRSVSRALDLDARGRRSYMRLQLRRLFPGPFGRTMYNLFRPFLSEPLDTTEKEKAWIELIQSLDALEAIEVPEVVVRVFSLEDTPYAPQDVWELAYEEELFEKELDRNDVEHAMTTARELVRSCGDFLKPFFRYLEVLSSDFCAIREKLLEFRARNT